VIRRTFRRRSTRVALAAGATIAVGVSLAWLAAPARPTWDRDRILDAMRTVESGGRTDPPDGDQGRAIGPYQIHRAYWRDAVTFEPSLGGRYGDCRDRRYAERVIDAYMRRWVPGAWAAGDAEVIARTHNGGPDGAARAATLPYWQRIRTLLE
jgi:hypothetical protein